MDRKRIVIGAASFALGFFAVIGAMATIAVSYCAQAGMVCTIQGEH